METIHVVYLDPCSIFEQLQVEEALLRTSSANYCLFMEGTCEAIVLGLSSDLTSHVDLQKVQERKIPIYRRFSGGGVVFVDHNTFFITTIFNKTALSFPAFPKPLLQFGHSLYGSLVELKDNDYTKGEKKVGGNALSIVKTRVLHHTSFLWDFDLENTQLLKMPEKMPLYRKERAHEEFICKLKDFIPTKTSLFTEVIKNLKTKFHVQEKEITELLPYVHVPHRKTTERVF
jgi:lipoate---protein ligase